MFGEAWDSFKRFITPESHAESIVNEIYSVENKCMLGTSGFPPAPVYNPRLATVPAKAVNVIEIIGGATENLIDKSSAAIKKYLIIGFIGLAVLAAVYGWFGRK